tara:strand:+ start:8039 stop:9526 length:1488 start_codon:yes stop_codon:yes gene_type:complete
MKRFFFLASLILPWVSVLRAAEEIPQGLISETWMEVRMFNAKVGYSHITIRRKDDVVHTRTETTMKINRAGANVEMISIESTRETIDGKPLDFFNSVNLGNSPVRRKGEFQDGKIIVTATQLGREQVTEYPYDEKGLMAWGLELLSRKHGHEPGTKYEAWLYSPDFGLEAPTRITVEAKPKESYPWRNEQKEGVQLLTTMHSKIGDVTLSSWLDDNGLLARMTMEMAGIPIEMLATDHKTAMAEFEPTDLFTQSLLILDREIPRDASSVTYEIHPKKEQNLDLLPENGDFQKVLQRKDGVLEVTVNRSDHKALRDAKGHSAGIDLKYKTANLMIDSDDRRIQRLAQRASLGAKNVFDLAHRLRHFVSHYVRDKNLEVGFASASEVARDREGDCSEHAVLLAAMGRAKGLPSRIVAGLVYVPELAGKTKVMGYHMWTQFHLRGRWVDFDAALGESECAPTRIALMTTSLGDATLTELGLALLDYIGQVEIKVKKVE